MKRRWLKYSLLLCLTILILAVSFTQTGSFKNMLKTQLLGLLAQNLKAEVTISRLSGNVLSNFSVHGLLIRDSRGDTTAYIPLFTVGFSPLDLLKKRIVVQVLQIQNPIFHFSQYPDSSWNVQHLVPRSTGPADTTQKPISWQIYLPDIQFKDVKVYFHPLTKSSVIPDRITGLNANVSVQTKNQTIGVFLKRFYLTSQNPDFVVQQLQGDLSIAENRLVISGLSMDTGQSNITGNVEMDTKSPSIRIMLTSERLQLEEFGSFLSLPLHGELKMNTDVFIRKDSLDVKLDLASGDQTVSIAGIIITDSVVPFVALKMDMVDFNPLSFYGEAVQNLSLNGTMSVSGRSSTKNPDLMCQMDLINSRIIQKIDSLHIKAAVSKVWDIGLEIKDSRGEVSAACQIAQPTTLPQFNMTAHIKNIDLASVSGLDLESQIQSTVKLNGRLSPGNRPSGYFSISCPPISIGHVTLDTLYTSGQFSTSGYQIDSLVLKQKAGNVVFRGYGNYGRHHDLSYFISLNSAGKFPILDSLLARGTLKGTLATRPDFLALTCNLSLHDLQYAGQKADTVLGNLNLEQTAGELQGVLKGEIIKLTSIDTVRTIAINSRLENKNLDADIFIDKQDSVFCHVLSKIELDSLIRIQIPHIKFGFNGRHWTGRDLRLRYDTGKTAVHFDEIKLLSDGGTVRLSGTYQPPYFNDIQSRTELLLENLDFILPGIEGKLTANFMLNGNQQNPFFSGEISVDMGRYREFSLQKMTSHFNIQDSLMTWYARLGIDTGQFLNADGQFILHNTGNSWIIDKTAPFDLNVESSGLDLSMASSFVDQISRPSGGLVCRIELSNTLEQPYMWGNVQLVDGSFEVPELSSRFSRINMNINMERENIVLSRLDISSGKGTAKIDGVAKFENGEIQDVNLKLLCDNFEPVNNRELELKMNSHVELSGSADSPRFSGRIDIVRSKLYLQEFLKTANREPEPLLIATNTDTLRTTRRLTLAHRWLENLRGNLRLVIPRNTWLKSPDMNLEIAGELDLYKAEGNFDIFGTVRVLRGTYSMYGKRFDVVNGSLLFNGGEINPDIDLQVKHIFRGLDRTKNQLLLTISGTAAEPVLNFKLNDTPVAEADALSYLLFGQSIANLSGSDRSKIADQGDQSTTSTVQNFLTNQLSQQISQQLGQTLNLDMIEISGDTDLRNAAITVGKYITNNWFVSYQKEFTSERANEVVPAQVTLEYEVSRNLFLQAIQGSEEATGFDVIWKIEKY
ncbi:translocation/assembly module TamB [candidate division KSB1 bacterium]|nr:translocation/assembly module TamB [candidate division KSB1 bacterium]